MKRFILLLGGTGGRTLDALLTAASAGVFPAETLEVLLIDTDWRDADSTHRLNTKLADYQAVQLAMTEANLSRMAGGPFAVRLNCAEWPQSLPGDASSLQEITGDTALDALLCKAFFEEGDAQLDLREGFRNRRMLGQITFAGMLREAEENPEDSLTCAISAMNEAIEAGEEVRCVLMGSVCGGTGAAGFPALCRHIRRHTDGKARIGAILLGANCDQDNDTNAYDAILSYAREGLCDTVGMVALPASCRTEVPVGESQLTDWLAVYMMDVLLHRPDWLKGLFTVRAPEGALDWRIFGASADRYRLAYGQLMKTASLWQHILSESVGGRLNHPFGLRDRTFGWYAHFFRRMAYHGPAPKWLSRLLRSDAGNELLLKGAVDRMMTLVLLWMGGVCKSVPLDLRWASELGRIRRSCAKAYDKNTTTLSQLDLMDSAAVLEDTYADNVIYLDAADAAEDVGQGQRRVAELKMDAAVERNENITEQRKMGGTAVIRMLENALDDAKAEQTELHERYDEAVRRIEQAEKIAAAEDQYRIDDARVKLERLERHRAMLDSKVRFIRRDVENARRGGTRFEKPLPITAAPENRMFHCTWAERLSSLSGIRPDEVRVWWPEMVCGVETVSVRAALRLLRHAPVDHRLPLVSLLHGLLSVSMMAPAHPHEKEEAE